MSAESRAPADPPITDVPRESAAPSGDEVGPERTSDTSSDAPSPHLPEPKRGSLLWTVRGMIREVRPSQWVKNTFVLAPVVFAKQITHSSVIVSAVGAFGVFCILSGAVYTLNDLVDVEADRAHPVKRKRPIASGQVPPTLAKVMLAVLLVVGLTGAWIGPWQFGLAATSYFVLNIAYSLRLKKIPYLDVAMLSGFFVLRVVAGGFAILRTGTGGTKPFSFYLVACTALLAAFLGFGKRRHEISGANAAKQRAALQGYSPRVLTLAVILTGLASVAMYTAYTLDPKTMEFFHSRWLWMTAIHPLLGVLRFAQLVVTRPKAESPTQEMLRDVPFMLNLVCWVAEIIVIVYQLRPQAG
ncbi:MAG: UbiA prenyltransferase family protein [Polyangiaceae bacterium]